MVFKKWRIKKLEKLSIYTNKILKIFKNEKLVKEFRKNLETAKKILKNEKNSGNLKNLGNFKNC